MAARAVSSAPPAHGRLRGVATGRAKRWQLIALGLLSATGWTLLVEVVVRTDPTEVLNRVLFLATLTLGVFPLGALSAYAVRAPRVTLSAARTCLSDSLREGWLCAAVVTLNALLRMTSFWSPLAAGLVLALAVVVDVVAISQRWAPSRDLV